MKVVFICTDPATLDSRLPWPNVTRLAANSVTDRRKLVEDADMVLIQLDSSEVSTSEALQKLRGVTDAPILILDCHGKGLQAFIPTEQGGDAPVILPPLSRRRQRR